MVHDSTSESFLKKYENQIIAWVIVLILFLMCVLRYDFYFDLNDDTVMKDILAGVYTGVPESRNIQMLYPLSFFLSLIYRIFPNAPVYGIFLIICQFGCLFLMIQRSLKYGKNTFFKILLSLMWGSSAVALFLSHMIFVQYTVTSALLAATAVFLFMTTQRSLPASQYLKKNIVSILLILVAFCMRSEMLMLVFPFIGVAGLFIWSEEKEIFAIENIKKYMTVFGCICISLALGYLIDKAAYLGDDWKCFRDFFDSRTELYDFQEIPKYEGNEELYETIGFSKSEQYMLFAQYNFGMDDEIDSKILDSMSAYQAQKKTIEEPFLDNMRKALWNYRYRTFHKEQAGSNTPDDYPWNYIVIAAYLLVLTAGIWKARKEGQTLLKGLTDTGWKLALLGIVRTALWMFILIRGRDPVRITHSLYLVELIILMVMLLTRCKGRGMVILPAFICVLSLTAAAGGIEKTDREYTEREEVNRIYNGMKEYCRQKSDNFYFIDVYSNVSYQSKESQITYPYSDKMIAGTDNSLANYDIMGGWLCKSPLYEKKLQQFNLNSMQSALSEKENVYLMAELSKGTDWLIDFYKDQGKQIKIELMDSIEEVIGVYKITVAGEIMPISKTEKQSGDAG